MSALRCRQVNRSIVAVLLLGLGVAMGGVLVFIAAKPTEPETIEWLETPRSLAKFSLDSEVGEFNNQSLVGRWTVVLFGFLRCADVCPESLMQMAMLANSLADKSTKNDVAFVFVSVDPRRDSIGELSEFLRYFDSSFLGVSGSEEQLTQFAESLGIQFKVAAGKDSYRVAHSITFSIIDPEGTFRGRFRPGFDMAGLVRDFTSKL